MGLYWSYTCSYSSHPFGYMYVFFRVPKKKDPSQWLIEMGFLIFVVYGTMGYIHMYYNADNVLCKSTLSTT